MGYKANARTITIRFDEDHEHHGAEARVRGMSYGEWEAAAGLDGSEGDKGASSVDRFAKHLVSWNLEDDDDQPVPATPEGLRSVDTSLVAALNNAWYDALTGVHSSDPLPQSSTSGEPSLVESVPMEALSPSLAS